MRTLYEWMQRLRGTLRSGRSDGDLEQELRAHVELAAEDARRGGLDHDTAVRAARLAAGGASQTMEALRDQRGLPWLDDVVRDLRHGLRSLARAPGFAAVALLTLALGIGANTAIFSIVNAVILRPLGYPEPERLIYLTTRSANIEGTWFAAPEYLELRQLTTSFSSLGAYVAGEVSLMGRDRPWQVRVALVDAALLGALGVRPAQGRLFTEAETTPPSVRASPSSTPPASAVAILSHELWQTAFGGQPMVGETLRMNGQPFTVVGILPPGSDLMDQRTQLWLPLTLNERERSDRGSHFLFAIGRLKNGVTVGAARAEISALTEDWIGRTGLDAGDHAFRPMRAGRGHTIELEPLQERILGNAGRSIWVLQAGVGLVLLIACANLANLLLARAESRRHELAMRLALGASRGRLLRQFMTEGVMLSLAGGALGIALASAGLEALLAAYPSSLPRTGEIQLDTTVLLFTLGVSVASGLLFGLAPVMHARTHGAARSAITTRHRIRRSLVVAEVALAVMLVIGAGLLMRTVANLARVDSGFERSRAVTFSVTLAHADGAVRRQRFQQLLAALRTLPAVQAATAMTGLPPNRPANFNNIGVEHYTNARGQAMEVVDYDQYVMADYFETMGIPIVAGRTFTRSDLGSSNRVAVINETFARKIAQGRDVVGRRLRRCCGDDVPWTTIVGVATDVKQGGVDRATGTEMYMLVEQPEGPAPGNRMNVVMRTTMEMEQLAATLEKTVRSVDPAAPIVRLREMDAVFAESISRPRLLAQLLGAFAGLALLLAAVGTYGVLSYMVTARRGEIGIRMAVGANRWSVIALVMREGLRVTAAGVAIGLAGAIGAGSAIASLLFGVQPTDAATIAVVVAAIALVAAVACWLPAWRASRLDPNAVLRAD